MNSLSATTEFLDLLSEYLTAGGSFQAAFLEAVNDLSSGKIKKVLYKNRSEICTSDDLVKTVKASPDIFPKSFPVLLEEVFKDDEPSKKIKALSAYYKIVLDTWKSIQKSFIISVFLITASLLFLFAARHSISMADNIYTEWGVDLPLPTTLLITFSRFINNNEVWIVILISLILLYCLIIFRKEWVSSVILRIPGVGDLLMRIISHSFCKSTVVLIDTGIPPREIPQFLNSDYNIPLLRVSFKELNKKLQEGMHSLSTIGRKKLFPDSLINLMINGEEENVRTELQDHITFENSNLEAIHKRFNSLFIPLISLLLVVILAVILYCSYLPMLYVTPTLGQ